MAFDIQKSKRLAADDISEVDSDNNETTLNLVEQASKSNVIATQSWVSRILRGFCCWTRFFHTDVLHATSEVATANVRSREAHLDKIYAKSIVLTNKDGGMVKIKVGDDGRIDIEETLCSIYVYPNNCLVREYLEWSGNPVVDFGGLSPNETLANFLPFVGDEQSEFNGQKCYILCVADGKDELIGRTLLINAPFGKVIKRVVVVDSDGDETTQYQFDYTKNIEQLTINLPRFRDIQTGQECQINLPHPLRPWEDDGSSDVQLPQPPNSCTGVLPPTTSQTSTFDPEAMPDNPFDVEDDSGESEIDPQRIYETIYDEYEGNTYYNIPLKRSFFVNSAKTQYLMVELMDKVIVPDSTTYGD